MTTYGKEVKKRLIDLDKPQKWLIEEVNNKTGLFFDSSYLSKIMHGTKSSEKIVSAINTILNI